MYLYVQTYKHINNSQSSLYRLKPKSATNTDTVGTLSIPSGIAPDVDSAVVLVIAVADVALSAPTIVVSIAGAAGKNTGSSTRGEVVGQVEGRHSKIFIIQSKKIFLSIFCDYYMQYFLSSLSPFK